MSARSVILKTKDPNSNGERLVTIDELTGDLVTINPVHSHIHDGDMFQVDRLVEDVANDGDVELLVQVPAGGVMHMAFSVQNGGDAKLDLFEAPTITADGTPVTPINRNRTSLKASAVSIFHTPTTSADGTQLAAKLSAGGSGGNSAGGRAEVFAEWVLAPSQDYLVRLTNISGVAQNLGLEIDFYDPLAAAP